MSIGDNLRRIRKQKGMTQEQLANITDISITSIQRYELGKRQPTTDILLKLAKTLEVSIGELASEETYIIGKETYDKKLNKEIYENMSNEELINSFGFNDEKLKSLSNEERKKMIDDLSNIAPYRFELKNLLDKSDNITQEDLLNICNSIKDYYTKIIIKFQIEEYKPLYDKHIKLLELAKFQNEQIKKYQEICENMISDFKNADKN